jgi:hypothetical protein
MDDNQNTSIKIYLFIIKTNKRNSSAVFLSDKRPLLNLFYLNSFNKIIVLLLIIDLWVNKPPIIVEYYQTFMYYQLFLLSTIVYNTYSLDNNKKKYQFPWLMTENTWENKVAFDLRMKINHCDTYALFNKHEIQLHTIFPAD